ncbi:DUF6225 family protein [Streptomyces sp. NPDC057638]|uniref:DUF6225 family protein n=1 Tax=Streptomyces sp. NPDC057638 TaxID=3346190 RepID=UPI0036CB53D0
MTDTETIEHTPQVWTAGRLREALAGLPDETPLHIGVADGPGDFAGYGEFVLVDLDRVEKELPGQSSGLIEYTLFADYTAGQYEPDPA